MSIDSVATLIDILRSGRLLGPAQLDELERDLQSQFSDPRLLGRELVKRGWITPFQINQLFQGRARELVMGPYLLLERLGPGRIGPTYKALHHPTGCVRAVKILNREIAADAAAVSRLRQATRDASRLSRPHRVAVYEAEQVGEVVLLPMEFVPGTDLARLVQKSGPLPASEAVECVRQAALGLAPIHQRHGGHGNVTPAQIVRASPDGSIKLLGEDLTHLVSPGAKAPPDARSDLLGLGATLYCLLAGQMPAAREPGADPVAALGPDVPPELAGVVRKLLSSPPDPGFTTAAEVAEELAAFKKRATGTGALAGAGPLAAGDSASTGQHPGAAAPEPTPLLSASAVEPASSGNTPDSAAAASAALADSVTPESTVSGVHPEPARAVTASWSAGLRDRIRKRPWRTAAGMALVVLGLGLFVLFVLTPNQPEKTDDRSDGRKNDSSKTPSTPKKAAALEPVVVLGGLEGRQWGPIRCAAWNPKKPLVASGGEDNAIRLWDAETLQERGVLRGHTDAINCLAFSPDGRYLLSGGDDRSMFLWDVTARKLIAPFIGHAHAVQSVAFSTDGKRAASGTTGGAIHLWSVDAREPIRGWNGSHPVVTALVFSDDGKRLLSGGTDGKARLWEVAAGPAPTVLEGHTGAVTAVAFASGDKNAVTGSTDKTLILWELKGDKAVKLRTFTGHTDAVTSLALAPDGETLWSAGADASIRRWDLKTGKESAAPLKGHNGTVSALAISPDGSRFLSAGRDQTVRLWNAATGEELRPVRGHTLPVQAVALSPDGRYLLSGGADNMVRLWDVGQNKVVHHLKGSQNGVSVVAFSPDGQKALAACGDYSVRTWDVESGSVRGNFTSWKICPGTVNIAFMPGGGRVLTTDNSPVRVILRDMARGEDVRLMAATYLRQPLCLAVSADGKWALSGSEDWKVRLSEIETGKELLRLVGPTGAVLSVAFSSDGRSALAVSADRTVWRWDLKTGQDIQLADLPEPVTFTPAAAALAPEGNTLAYCGNDGRVILWDVKRGKELGRVQLTGPVTRLAFSADGRFLATANANGTAAVFRVGGGAGNAK
jgi:WD40 repeat protein